MTKGTDPVMTQHFTLASTLIRLRDIHDHPIIASTDGHRVRLLIHEGEDPHSGWHYTDLGPHAANELAAALSIRCRPRPLRRLARWFGSYRSRR
ncbi:hypothetical protein [Nocardia nepalensis]|uniref:hypothetical protein n=1 Tax=Nocardia nepalensis TaxID=3375448 RepID=UPI003B674CF4